MKNTAILTNIFSADNYLITAAEPRRLLRLRKDELVRLYTAAGLPDDAELLTKNEIVDCIVAARDDVVSLPPSSPGPADSASSDYSSDGGNVAGGEETDFGVGFPNGLKRSVTLQGLPRAPRRRVDRALSLNSLDRQRHPTTSLNGKRSRATSEAVTPLKASALSRARYVDCISKSMFLISR